MFKMLLEDAKQLFLNPKSFFSGLKKGDSNQAMLKAVIYSAVIGLLYFLNELIRPQFINLGVSLGQLVLAVIFGFIGLFVGAFIIKIIAMIVSSKAGYGDCLSITAALYPIFVVYAFLGQVLSFNGLLSWAVMAFAWIYGLFILFYAILNGLEGEEKISRSMIGILILIVIFVLAVPLMAGFLGRGYQNVRMQAQSLVQRIFGAGPRRVAPSYPQNMGMMRYPAPAQPGQPVPQQGMPNPALPQAPGLPAAPVQVPAQSSNSDLMRRMIQSNTKMTPEQKRQALQRLEATQRNQGK